MLARAVPTDGGPGRGAGRRRRSGERGAMAEDRRLNVFFDVDYTLIMADGRLRNHTEEVFSRLKQAGHSIYIWSGVGIRRFDMRLHGLDGYVDDYFVKPLYRYRERLEEMDVTVMPDYVIDDHSQVVAAFDHGYHIPDIARRDDRELLYILEEIEALARGETVDWDAVESE